MSRVLALMLGRRRAGEPGVASRYSRFVDMMRFLLPATALVLVGLVIFWPRLMGGYSGLIMPMLAKVEVDSSDAMRMHQPRYAGQTDAAEPYAVTAEAAVVHPARPNFVKLDRLKADLERTGKRDLRLLAASGVYHRTREKLDLAGGIELTTSDGYRFETETAQVNLQRGKVVGRQPIEGAGPAGTLEADRFEIRDGGDVLRFEGRVKVTVQPQRDDGKRS